jgi:hypothetical protein
MAVGVDQTREQDYVAEVDDVAGRGEILPRSDAADAIAGDCDGAVFDRRPGDWQDDAGAEKKLGVGS